MDNLQRLLSLDTRRLALVVRAVLAQEQCESATISLAIVDNETIHELNRRYLNHDYPTDVLSFLLECEWVKSGFPNATGAPLGTGKRIDGEIIVSAEMARQMAKTYDWRPEDELMLYVVHGLLHLCGYDDVRDRERRRMRQRERELLKLWNLTPHYSED